MIYCATLLIFLGFLANAFAEEAVCGGKLFVKDSLTIDIPNDLSGCRCVIETEPNRILFISSVHLFKLQEERDL